MLRRGVDPSSNGRVLVVQAAAVRARKSNGLDLCRRVLVVRCTRRALSQQARREARLDVRVLLQAVAPAFQRVPDLAVLALEALLVCFRRQAKPRVAHGQQQGQVSDAEASATRRAKKAQ